MPAKLDRCVKEVLKKKVAKFKEDNGRKPNKDEKDDMESSAWAICQSALSESEE